MYWLICSVAVPFVEAVEGAMLSVRTIGFVADPLPLFGSMHDDMHRAISAFIHLAMLSKMAFVHRPRAEPAFASARGTLIADNMR